MDTLRERLNKMMTQTTITRIEDIVKALINDNEVILVSDNNIYVRYNHVELHFIIYHNKVIWCCYLANDSKKFYASGSICNSTLKYDLSLNNKIRKILKATKCRDNSMIMKLKEVV